MSSILLISIATRVVTLGWSIILFRQLRNGRVALLAGVIFLLASHEMMGLSNSTGIWPLEYYNKISEFLGLTISFVIAFGIFVLTRVARERRMNIAAKELSHNKLNAEIEVRAKVEIALRESEAQLSMIADNLPALINYVDASGHFQFCNKTAEAWYGRPRSEIIGRTVREVLGETIYEKISEKILAAQSGQHVTFRDTIDYPDGNTRYIEIEYVPSSAVNGEPNGYVGLVLDRTSQLQSEHVLQESEMRFRGIFDQAAVGIALMTPGGRFLSVNQKVCDLLGLSNEEILGMRVVEIVNPDDIQASIAQAARLISGEISSFTMEVRYQPENAPAFWGNVTASIIKSPDSEHITFLAIVEDVSEPKRVEGMLRQVQKLDAVGQLASGIAHDFNNLLVAIMGNAELISNEAKAGDTRAEAILKAAMRGAELSHRLLAFSREQPLLTQNVDVEALVGNMKNLLERSLGETVEINTAFAAELWPVAIDPGQLENALLNLAINARDAMPSGGTLLIEASNVQTNEFDVSESGESTAKDYIMLVVSDTGSGMAADIVARVFEPFFTTKEVGEGSGLGLAMIYGFAKQSDGHVTIDSKLGEGTTVRLYLPRMVKEPAQIEKEQTADIPRSKGESILVVEDDPEVRQLVVRMLDDLGYQVQHASDGTEALACLEDQFVPDLLLSDVILSRELNGPELAEIVIQNDPAIKVLFMSGYKNHPARQGGPDIDNFELINKPFRMKELAWKLREVLDA